MRATEANGRGGGTSLFGIGGTSSSSSSSSSTWSPTTTYTPPPTVERFDASWYKGWVTKFHGVVKAELFGSIPTGGSTSTSSTLTLPTVPTAAEGGAASGADTGIWFNVTLAYSTCSGVACWEQYLFDEPGVPPRTMASVQATWTTREQLTQPSPPPPPVPPPPPSTTNATKVGTPIIAAGDGMGAALASDWALGVLLAILVVTAASMFGAFEMALPASATARLDEWTRTMARAAPRSAAFAQGLVFGLIASPCTGPFALSILVYVAESGSLSSGARGGGGGGRNRLDAAVLGFAALLLFGIGLGTILLLAAVFAGVLTRLPKPGPWLRDAKRHGGFVVLMMTCTLVASRLDGEGLAACFWSVATAWIVFTCVSVRYAIVPWEEAPFEMLMRKNEMRPLACLRGFPALVPWRDMPSLEADVEADVAGCDSSPSSSSSNRSWRSWRRRAARAFVLVCVVIVGTYLAWSWSASGDVFMWQGFPRVFFPCSHETLVYESGLTFLFPFSSFFFSIPVVLFLQNMCVKLSKLKVASYPTQIDEWIFLCMWVSTTLRRGHPPRSFMVRGPS